MFASKVLNNTHCNYEELSRLGIVDCKNKNAVSQYAGKRSENSTIRCLSVYGLPSPSAEKGRASCQAAQPTKAGHVRGAA